MAISPTRGSEEVFRDGVVLELLLLPTFREHYRITFITVQLAGLPALALLDPSASSFATASELNEIRNDSFSVPT